MPQNLLIQIAAVADYENKKEDVGFTMRWAGVYELIKSWER